MDPIDLSELFAEDGPLAEFLPFFTFALDLKLVSDINTTVADLIAALGPDNPATPGLEGLLAFTGNALLPLLATAPREGPFVGTDEADVFAGGFAADFASGGAGFDVLSGGFGTDILLGGEGNDVVFGGFDGDVVLGEAGNDILAGEAGDDLVFGGAGLDFVTGGSGDDTIVGGADSDMPGGDLLVGGEGSDTFIITLDAGLDTIADFTPGEDTLDLRQFGLDPGDPLPVFDAVLSTGGIGSTLVLAAGTVFVEFVGLSAAEVSGADIVLA